MVETSLHWLAGLLEGEGSFLPGPPSSPNSPLICIETTDQDVATRVASLLGVKVSSHKARRANWKPTFTVRRKGYVAVELMKQLYPLMGARRQGQIEAALASATTLKKALSPEECREIREKLKGGANYLDVAQEYGINRSTVYNVKNQKHAYANVA